MRDITSAPDISRLDVPIDAWTAPFWTAAAAGKLVAPRCGDCHRFRWPPGPFCPHCQSQRVEWRDSGPARIYSFTIVCTPQDNGGAIVHAPALIEFPQAGGIRMLAAIVDAPLTALRIGAPLRLGWWQAANAVAPVFRLESDAT